MFVETALKWKKVPFFIDHMVDCDECFELSTVVHTREHECKEVEFQYGGWLYFETGSSYISAANGNISTKFGLLIDFNLLKAVTSTDTKPEVVFSRRGRHLEK